MSECSKTDHDARARWAAKHGLKLSTRRKDWHGFMGRRWGYRYSQAMRDDDTLRASWDDHGEVWVRSESSGRGFKRPACYTAQPYDLDDQARADLDDISAAHNLRVEIHPPADSWYNPGQTWLVILWAPERG